MKEERRTSPQISRIHTDRNRKGFCFVDGKNLRVETVKMVLRRFSWKQPFSIKRRIPHAKNAKDAKNL